MCLGEFWWLDKYEKCSLAQKNSQLVLFISTLVRGKVSPQARILTSGTWVWYSGPRTVGCRLSSSDGGLVGAVPWDNSSQIPPLALSSLDRRFFSFLLCMLPSLQSISLLCILPHLAQSVGEQKNSVYKHASKSFSLVHAHLVFGGQGTGGGRQAGMCSFLLCCGLDREADRTLHLKKYTT